TWARSDADVPVRSRGKHTRNTKHVFRHSPSNGATYRTIFLTAGSVVPGSANSDPSRNNRRGMNSSSFGFFPIAPPSPALATHSSLTLRLPTGHTNQPFNEGEPLNLHDACHCLARPQGRSCLPSRD